MSAGREIAQFEVLALQRDELGALLEQRVAPVRLEVEIVLHRGGERLVAFGAKIGFGERAGEAHLRLRLGEALLRRTQCERASARGHQRAAGELNGHGVSSLELRSSSGCASEPILLRLANIRSIGNFVFV